MPTCIDKKVERLNLVGDSERLFALIALEISSKQEPEHLPQILERIKRAIEDPSSLGQPTKTALGKVFEKNYGLKTPKIDYLFGDSLEFNASLRQLYEDLQNYKSKEKRVADVCQDVADEFRVTKDYFGSHRVRLDFFR